MSDFDLSTVVPDPVRNAYLDERAFGVSDTDSPDRQRWAYSHLMERSFGIKDFDGRQINNMKPIEDPWQALSRVREAISKSTFEPLVDDDYKALKAATTFDDKLSLARERTGWWNRSAEPAIKDAVKAVTVPPLSLDELALLGDGDIDPLDAKKLRFYHEKLIPRIRELASRQNSIDQDSGAVYDDLSPEEHDALGILRESADEIAAISEKYRPIVRDKSLVRDFENKVRQQNAWITVAAAKQLGEDLRPIISEAGRTVLEYAETHEGDLGEYDKLFLGLDPDERGMLSPIIHMLKPNRDDAWLYNDAARAFWDQAKGIPVNALRAVEGAVVRSVVDGESYQMLREAEADLRLANQDKMKEWGVFGDAVIGAVGTIPHMLYSLVPYAGFALMAMDASQRFEDQVAEQGGDVAGMDFFMAKYAFGAAYAAVERAQTKLLTRKLAPGVARQAHLDMFHSIHAALKTGGIAAGHFAYETWEEGLQGGLEKGFVAWGLDKDVTSEVVAGIVTEMKDSAGTMVLLSAGGAVGNRIRYRRGAFENGADALASLSRLKDLQTKIAGNPGGREMKDFGAEYGYFARQWLNNGRKGLLDMGLTPMMAESMSKSFQGVWNAIEGDDAARRRFADGGRVLTMAEYASKAMPWLDVTTNDDGTLHFRRKADAPAGSPDVDIDLEVVPGGIKLDYANQNVVAGIVDFYNRGRPVEEQTTVERFNALGEAEKDAFVEANNIRSEGYYTATAPSGARVDSEQLEALEFVDEEGRSLGDAAEEGLTLEEISARGYNVVRPSADGKSQRVTLMPAKKATRMSGRIVLSGKEAPSAQFHELFHAVSRFLVDSGQLDAGAVEGMRALFGDPRSDGEAFNEEVAAEAYRGFLQGKVNMVEDGMLRKFADAVGQALKFMRLVHDKRRDDMAEWEQVFSDVQSGNFSGIPVAANSAAKKLAMARAADESRKKAREESDAKHKKPDAKPDAAPDAAPAAPAASGDGSGAGGAEEARKAAAARFGAPAPVEQVRQPDKPVSSGEETVVTIKNARGEDVQIDVAKFTVWDEPETGVFSVMYPGGKGRLWGYYACIDVDEITTSSDDGYDKSLQDRLGRLDGDANSATQIDSISKNLQFQLLVSSPETSGGPPIIKFREAVVDGKKVSLPMAVTGNGRVLAYRKAVLEGNADAFVEGMVSGAQRLRIPGVESQKHPMLVRVMTSDIDDAKLVEAAQAANVSSVSNKTKHETALTDGRLINANDGILDLLSVGESYDFGSASNFAFLLEFSRLVGETGVFSTSASFSPEFHERAANAALGALVMRSMPIDEAREFISDVFKNSEAVGAKVAFDVLKAVSGSLVALDRNLPNYSISLDLAYALKDLMTLKRRRRIQRDKNLHEMTVDEFLKETDFLRVRSGVTDSLLRELADRTSQQSILDLFSKYFSLANQYIDQVGPTPQLGLDFSGSGMYSIEMKPRWELLDEAVEATLSEKEAASRQKTRGDFVNYNARPVPPKPVVPAKSSATPAKTPAKPVRPDRDPLPRQSVGALEEIDMLRLRSEAMLEGVIRGYRMSQAEIEADPVLAAIKHRVETTVVDGLSGELGRKPQAVKNWFLDRIPCFQGSKREMGPFVATAILRMNRAQRENFSKAVGWFSGTGTFEMSMAVLKLANGEYMLPNVKEIELHEYDAGRVEQTRFFWEHGNDVEDYIASTKVADIWAAAVDQEMARIANLRKNMLIDNEQTRRTEERMTFAKVAAVFAQWDAKTTAEKALKAQILERAMSDRQSNGPSKKAQPKDGNAVAADASAEAGVDIEFDPDAEDSDEVALSEGKELMPNEDRVLWFKKRFFSTYVETIKNNAEATWRVYDEFTRVKGGKVSIVEGDSYQAEISRGDDVLSFVDPPYVDTLGYSSWRRVEKDGKVSFELVKPESNGVDLYEQTAGILERLSNAGHGLVYTDESFTFAKVNKNGTIKRPKVLAGALPVYMRLQKNFDEIGSVKKLIGAGRMETIGVRAGGYDNASYRHSENEKLAEEGGRGDGVPGADSASGRAGGERIKPENVAGDGSGPRTGEGMVLAGLPDAVGDGDSTGVQGLGREAELGEVAGGDDAARGQPGRVEDIGLFAEHGSWGGGQAPGQGAVGRGGGGDQDVGAAEADAGGARSESDAAQRRYSIVGDRLFAAVTGGLQAQIDAAQGRDAKQSVVDAWKAENPERYAELEKMREAALKAAGYTSPRLFRGSVEDDGVELQESFEAGGGIFLTDSEDVAAIFTFPREFGESITSQYDEETGDDVDVEPGPIIQAYAKLENPLVLTRDTEVDSKDFVIDSGLQSKTIKQAKASGKDGIVVKDTKEGVGEWMEEGTTYVVFKSSQVKLTEPISLDASGMLIPPSQWADESKPDIRYSIVGDRGGDIDAAMKAGFTERVFHGTGANRITKFRPGSKSHGVKAAYLSYDRGAASSYAALAKLDGQDNAHVEEYLVNPGRMLAVDAADTPDFGGFGDFLKKAKSDGYDSVKVAGLLDDQHLRLDDDGEVVFPDYEWDNAAPTDVLIVFDSRRIKMAKSGVHLSNRFDLGVDDTRYSIVGDRGGESLGVTNDAEKMEADGIARETIWRETGWWRGPDRKWRFEVDEDFFRVRKSAFKQLGKRPIKLGTLLRDNPVFHAYPQIRDVKVVLDDGSNPFGSTGELDVENGTITLAKRLKRYDGDVSHTLSHEIQHLIQEYEGFAKGGNFSTVAFDWDSSKIDIQAENPALSWAMGVFRPMYRRLHPEPSEQVREDGERLANELGRDGVQDKVNGLVDRIYNERQMNAYLLLAGEVESRVVQDRLWMEKEERKSEPPWVTMERILREDKLLKEGQTPDDVLIVKGADGVQDTSRRHSLYSPYQSGRFGAGTILSAIIATDKVKGIERTDEAYQQLATALRTKTDVAKAKAEADAFLRRETKAASMDVSDIAQSMTQEKFPELVEKLFSKGSDYGVEVGTRAQQGMMRAEKNAIEDARGATLHDMVADTGVDIARILLSVYPEAFDPSLEERRAKAKENDADEAGAAAAGRGEFVGPPTEEQVASRSKLDAERKRKAAILVAKLQAWRLQMAEAKAREERDAALRAKEDELNAESAAENSDDELDADDEADMQDLIVPPEIIADSGVDLNDALEFAHFLRLWVESWLAGPGVDPGATLGDRINVAKFRKTMIAQLGDIASKWLDPKDGRTAVNIEKQIDAIPESADPDTIERRTASIIATIQRAAIRQNRDRLVKEARESIAKLALAGKQIDEMEKDVKRKIKGNHEATARYVSEILSWGPQRIEREMVRLDNIVNDRDAAYAAAQAEHGKDVRMASDVQVHRALERRAALERWGGLKHKLPADILRGKAEIEAWLKTERLAHEAKWEGQKAKWDRLAEIVQKAATRDSRRAKPGKLGIMGRFADETSATIRQKLEVIMQGGGAEAAEAIALIEDMFNEGSQKLGVYRAKYRMQIEDAFKFAVQGQDMTQRQLMELLDEQIPAELNARISSGDQGALDMTWKQAAQLYSYLLQTASYKDNIAKWGRDGQRELLRDAMPVPVVRLVAKLQDIYQQRREELSALVEDVTGFPVYNPDPLYMPVKMFLGAREGLDTQVHGWSPLAKSLTPRKVHGRDCDEHADIITMYNESTEAAVRALAFGSTGIAIRSILARQATADAIARHHGDEALRALRSQITDTLNDGWRESGGGLMLGLVRKASNFTTYSSLSYNFQSGLVQFAASPAWIEVLEGGIGEMLRHIANFDMDSARELVAAPGFVSRYGNESFGQMIRESFADKRVHPILRVYKAGMTVVQFADFLASVLVGTGVYKAQKEANAKKGMAPDQAAEAAARTAWGMIEYAQQSSRVMNTPEFMRRHGLIARQLYKFQSGPLLQLSHETHAFRLVNRAAKGDERRQAVKHLLNVLVANHVMLPLAMTTVQTAFGALLGDEPDEEEVFGTLLVEMLLGPAASIIFVGAIMSRTVGGVVKATTGLKPRSYPGDGGMPAAQQLERLAKTGALLPSDIAALDFEGFRDDMATMLGQVFAPARYAKKAVYNATDYDPAAERRKRQRQRRR